MTTRCVWLHPSLNRPDLNYDHPLFFRGPLLLKQHLSLEATLLLRSCITWNFPLRLRSSFSIPPLTLRSTYFWGDHYVTWMLCNVAANPGGSGAHRRQSGEQQDLGVGPLQRRLGQDGSGKWTYIQTALMAFSLSLRGWHWSPWLPSV